MRGANAKQSFKEVLGLHFESDKPAKGKLHHSDDEDDSDEDE